MRHLAWLTLKSVPGIGNLLFKRLTDRFFTPEKVLNASPKELCQIEGISERLASAIRCQKTPYAAIKDAEAAMHNGCRSIVMTDPEYPRLLLEIPDPPPVLWVRGTLSDTPHIAVIGSRNATSYGLFNARRIASDLATAGACIVSGLARGIDSAAHNGALDKKGKTIAVLGSGLGNIYPAENRVLADKISENGAVISEFSYHAAPDAKNFPMRNRIISGISLGTVVVEAAKKSGSLITARLAAEQNREVFAIPGSINSFQSSGTHSLLKQGAKLVENTNDILEELSTAAFFYSSDEKNNEQINDKNHIKLIKNKFALDFDELSVIKVLDLYPVHIDDILYKVSMDSGTLSGILLKLELKGIVNQSPGKLFSINEDMH